MSTAEEGMLLDRLLALPDQDLRQSGWSHHELAAGSRLCSEGEPADAMYVVADGSLQVSVGDRPVAEVGLGATIGEASVFIRGETRRASVVALTDAHLLRLGRARLRHLREDSSDIYDHLLDMALGSLWRCLEQQDRRIVELVPGETAVPASGRPRGLAKLWQHLRPAERGGPPAIDAVLALDPVLGEAEAYLRLPLSRVMTPHRLVAGKALFLEGDGGRTLYLVAAGRLSILRKTQASRAQALATVGPGEFVGVGSFLTGRPRSAAAVAVEDGWAFSIEPAEVEGLPFFSRRLLHEALVTALRGQLAEVNEALVSLELGSGTIAPDPVTSGGR